MTTPERPTPAEILEMVREYGEHKFWEGQFLRKSKPAEASLHAAEEVEVKIAAALALYDWRPIAEAPKDGTEILGVDVDQDGVAFYSHISWSNEFIGAEPLRWSHVETRKPAEVPTHFQPLPAPPKEG